MRVQSLSFLFKHTCKCSQLFILELTKFSNTATIVTFSAKKRKPVNTDKGEISHIVLLLLEQLAKSIIVTTDSNLDTLMALHNYTDRRNTVK